jgi:hypothetical protein
LQKNKGENMNKFKTKNSASKKSFYQIVSSRPIVAFKVYTLLKTSELRRFPDIRISLNNGDIMEGRFNGVDFINGTFQLNLLNFINQMVHLEIENIDSIESMDLESEQFSKEISKKILKVHFELEQYLKDYKAAKEINLYQQVC